MCPLDLDFDGDTDLSDTYLENELVNDDSDSDYGDSSDSDD